MKMAVISPTALQREIQEVHKLDYHLVLAQRYLRDKDYAAFHIERYQAGDFLILDQGAAELKSSVSVHSIMAVADVLHPTMIVAPDDIYNKDATIAHTRYFLDNWADNLHAQGINVIAIPQGGDRAEWFDCFQTFNRDCRIDWLGISMFYTPQFNNRYDLLQRIAPSVSKPCHLFGLWSNPFSLAIEKEFDFVKGVDTAKTVEFALEGLTLEDWAQHQHIDDDWYFMTAGYDLGPDGASTIELMHSNIQAFKEIVS